MFVSFPAARFHALCVSMCMPTCTRYVCGSAGTFTLLLSRQRGTSTHCTYAVAWALSRTACMRQRGHFHSSTVPLSRQRGGTWACLYVGGDGLPDCSALSLFGLRSSRWSVSCGPAALRVWFVLSCCQRCMRHDLAPPMSAAMPAAALAAATREVALEAWRWRLGAGGLALEASWPVAVRRRPLVVALGAAWRGVARRGMWRGE